MKYIYINHLTEDFLQKYTKYHWIPLILYIIDTFHYKIYHVAQNEMNSKSEMENYLQNISFIQDIQKFVQFDS